MQHAEARTKHQGKQTMQTGYNAGKDQRINPQDARKYQIRINVIKAVILSSVTNSYNVNHLLASHTPLLAKRCLKSAYTPFKCMARYWRITKINMFRIPSYLWPFWTLYNNFGYLRNSTRRSTLGSHEQVPPTEHSFKSGCKSAISRASTYTKCRRRNSPCKSLLPQLTW